MTDKKKLKPCPFCGGEAKVVKADITYTVMCIQCPATIGRQWYAERKEAVEAWNRRVDGDHFD